MRGRAEARDVVRCARSEAARESADLQNEWYGKNTIQPEVGSGSAENLKTRVGLTDRADAQAVLTVASEAPRSGKPALDKH